MYLLLFSGCRISGELNATIEQIDFGERAIWLRTLKRRRLTYRRIPLIDMLTALTCAKDGRLWAIHRGTAWRWVRAVAEKAHVKEPMAYCRGMRHSYAMHATAHQVLPFVLRRLMVHASLDTTLIYADAVAVE